MLQMVATIWMIVLLATMMLATSIVMMKVPSLVTIGIGNEAYCPCEENADRDTMTGSLMVRKTMTASLMVMNIVINMMDVVTKYVDRTYICTYVC